MTNDFEQFFNEREKAASAYVAGDGSLVDALVPHEGDASFHSPGGDSVTGAQAVAARYLRDARAFKPIGKSRFEVLQKGCSGDMAFWTGYQIATVQIGDMPRPMDMRIRLTEVFRKIGGKWKMVHRHADMGEVPGKQAPRQASVVPPISFFACPKHASNPARSVISAPAATAVRTSMPPDSVIAISIIRFSARRKSSISTPSASLSNGRSMRARPIAERSLRSNGVFV
jgi:ketosteroid isomerase-like protein